MTVLHNRIALPAVCDLLDRLISGADGELAVFFGAGISAPAGLPLAAPLLEALLVECGIDADDLRELISIDGNIALPFESCIEVFLTNVNNSELLRLFELGQPTAGHVVVAKLISEGRVHSAYTTNFDCLLEEALSELGIREEVDYSVRASETSFEVATDTSLQLYKLHGSSRDLATIRTTLAAVASARLSALRRAPVERLFRDGSHKSVLILGYSCSDVFDIVPAIEAITDSSMEVVLIQHVEDAHDLGTCLIESVATSTSRNPFRGYRGWRVYANANDVVEHLRRQLGLLDTVIRPEALDWRAHIETWLSPMRGTHIPDSIIGQIFYRISDTPRARRYYDRALEAASRRGDVAHEGATLSNIGLLYSDADEHETARTHFERALECFISAGHRVGVASAHANLGFSLAFIDADLAIRHSREAIRLADDGPYPWIKANALNNLGLAYKLLLDYASARRRYGEALEANPDDLQGLVTTLNNLAALDILSNDFASARLSAERAGDLAKILGYRHGQLDAVAHLANIDRQEQGGGNAPLSG